MLHLTRWQSGPAFVVTLGILSSTIVPLTVPIPATAQSPGAPLTLAQAWSNPSRAVLPAGTRLPVRLNQSQNLVVAPNETRALTLNVSRNVWSTSGELLIPAVSQVQGRLVPVRGGAQFVASSLRLTDGTVRSLNATSGVIPITQTVPPGVNPGAVWKGAAIGAGTSTVISGVSGNRRITIPKVLAGAGGGALGGVVFGRRGEVNAIVINPDRDLTLTVNQTVTLR